MLKKSAYTRHILTKQLGIKYDDSTRINYKDTMILPKQVISTNKMVFKTNIPTNKELHSDHWYNVLRSKKNTTYDPQNNTLSIAQSRRLWQKKESNTARQKPVAVLEL